jgi:hypothetical protein
VVTSGYGFDFLYHGNGSCRRPIKRLDIYNQRVYTLQSVLLQGLQLPSSYMRGYYYDTQCQDVAGEQGSQEIDPEGRSKAPSRGPDEERRHYHSTQGTAKRPPDLIRALAW